jgi:hypothetical protein
MKFGVFDHVDDSGLPLKRHLENRLKIIEAYDRRGCTATPWPSITARLWVTRLHPQSSLRRRPRHQAH